MVSTSTLKKIAVAGGVIALCGGGFFSWRIHANFRDGEYYKKSVQLLQNYKPAADRLGQPIKTGRLDLGDTTTTWVDGFKAQLKISVKGPRKKGRLYSWASRATVKDSWEVDKLDLEVDGYTRWTFYIKQGAPYVQTRLDQDGNVIPESVRPVITDQDELLPSTDDDMFYTKLKEIEIKK